MHGARAESALRRAARLDLGVLVELETAVGPYLEECGAAGSSARIAVTGPADSAAVRARELSLEAGVSVDLWIEVDPVRPDALEAAHRVADELMAAGASR